jgi:hypothetical protein
MARATLRDNLDPRVTNPLDALRGTIRRYVVLEGVLAAGVLVVGWFALGLVLDYGVFKATGFDWFGSVTPFSWDWAQDAPWWFRAVALAAAVAVVAAVVYRRVVGRLRKELSYPALAMVLERKYPDLLGDRLITAVELADVDRAAKHGFSPEMIRATIAEANERVGKVAVREVFNWHRLWVMGYVVAGLLAGVGLLAFVAHLVATESVSPRRFGWKSAHVAGIFLERNVLLQDTPWPRQAHLELVEFPASGDLRIGKDAPAPRVRARAYQWVVAAPGTRDGWRPMTWSDVTPELLGGPVPAQPAGVKSDTPLDDVEALARAGGSPQTGEFRDVLAVLDTLDTRADEPSMARTFRKLAVPENVNLAYTGATVEGSATLAPERNNEFAAKIEGLKESVVFGVRAADFRTARRGITLVPAPLVRKLTAAQYQPAYLFHGPPQNEGYAALRGLRQRVADRDLTLTGKRSLLGVPPGTELVLTATTDKPVVTAAVRPKIGRVPGAKPGSQDPVPLAVTGDRNTFALAFRGDDRLTAGVEFEFEFTDTDGVRNTREIQIQVAEDQPPVVEVMVDVVRKVGPYYYVTPVAKVPFNPDSVIRDDFGLSNLTYSYTSWPEVSDEGREFLVGQFARVFLDAPAPARFPSAALPPAYFQLAFGPSSVRTPGSAGVNRYFELRRALRAETADQLRAMLTVPVEEGRAEVIRKVELRSGTEDFFDVGQLGLRATAGDVQQRYRIDLSVVATDTNFDTGPKTGQSQEVVKFLVVSESDLLAEINKEEEALAGKLDEALAKLAGARAKYAFVGSKNGRVGKEELDVVKVRAGDAVGDVQKARDIVQTVAREYRRICRECVVNGVTAATTVRFGLFSSRIDLLLGEAPSPTTPDEAKETANLPKPRTTFPDADRLLTQVQTPLNAGEWAPDAEVAGAQNLLMLLEEELAKLRRELGEKFDDTALKRILRATLEDRNRLLAQKRQWQKSAGEAVTLAEAEVVAIGPQFLARGEAKKFKHAINWRQYKGPAGKEDELVVKVAVSDPKGLTAPPELVLDFTRDELSFEYEVKAGTVPGDYTLTLTPQPGKPVTVTVTVR